MLGRRFWIYTLSIGLALAGVAAGEPVSTVEPKATSLPEIPGLTSASSYRSEENGKVLVAINAQFSSNGAFLAAKLIRFDTRNGLITAEGDVVYATSNLRILGEKAVLDPKKDLIIAQNVRFGRNPVYFTADEIRVEQGDKSMKGLRMWQNEPSPNGLSLKIATAQYTEKDDWLALHHVTPQLAGLPFFYIPYYGQEGYKEIPYEVFLNMGTRERQGTFLRTTTLARQTKAFWAGALVDFYSKSGLLVGPYLKYDNTKDLAAPTRWNGSLQMGFINDRGDLILNSYGLNTGRNRNFQFGEVTGRTRDGLEITGQLFGISDPDFMRDYRPQLLYQTGFAQATAGLTQAWHDGFVSATLVAKVDDYQGVVQKLPELRYDLPETPWGELGLRQRSFVSLAYLSADASVLAPAGSDWTAGRLDTYYGWTLPKTLGEGLTIKPVVGLRATEWTASLQNQGSQTKIMGQAGFDVEALFTGSWDLVAKKWSIDGMRHSFRPILQYRSFPGAAQTAGNVLLADPTVALSSLQEFDLADRPDAGLLTASQAARFGFRNTLATRDTINGTRDLLRFDVFTDWQKDAVTRAAGRSDLQAQIRLTPAPWVSIDSFQRLPNGGGAAYESINSISFNSGDFWKATFGWYQLRQAEVSDQLWFTGEIRLNSVYSGLLTTNYDALTGQMAFLSVGVIQRIGNSWEIQYGLQKRVSNFGDNALGFQLRARLFKF